MKAILYFLAIVASLVGSYLAYQNTNELKSKQTTIKETAKKKDRVKKKIKEAEEDIETLNGELDTLETSIADASARIDSAASKEDRLKKELVDLETELLELDEEVEGVRSIQEEQQEVLASVGVDTVDEIPDKIAEIDSQIKGKQDELNDVVLINEKLSEKIVRDTETKIAKEGRLASIKNRISTNNLLGTVTAVNRDWGFVVINKGAENSLIQEGSELLVQRGGRFVGKLKATTLNPTQTICDLDLNGFRRGSLVRPGDNVILKETTKN